MPSIKRPYTRLFIELQNDRKKQENNKAKPKPLLWFALREKSASSPLLTTSSRS
tara:strand:+ start:1319 stop:1480 length:162 start_codon:yes stop_codon:yes gene_type:complete